jgi:pimeloyl-ACP methyl ester carboxylesterase
MKAFVCVIAVFCLSILSFSQKRVSFQAADGLEITADLYELDETNPYVLLFHQDGSSRGEFQEIAGRLTKFGYNCLAVDLRSGEEENYMQNETARRAKELAVSNDLIDCKKDIEAAISYACEKNGKNVVLFGSSFSASLSLVVGKDHPNVAAVIAFSPGEFFPSEFKVSELLVDYPKPVFAAGMKREEPYLVELLDLVPEDKKTIFVPETSEGGYGAKALWESNNSSFEYWLGLLVFFKNIAPPEQ